MGLESFRYRGRKLKSRSAYYYTLIIKIVMATLLLVGLQLNSVGAQYPNLENLKSSKLSLVVQARLALNSNGLRNRAKHILDQYGIEVVPDGNAPDDHSPRLVLSVDLEDLGGEGVIPGLEQTCPGKYLYIRKLELWEDVRVSRIGSRPLRAVTWSRGFPLPVIVEMISEEQLQSDAERLIEEFALDYRQGNRP